ncbi:DUF885 domain-containing protein [Yunchengibacter salinarum]|uniref:DUF885 domain-containing protein n=1 Tax=Yunchengibacter salinarum TaxID=3133399 RepID=UPI0035B666D7
MITALTRGRLQSRAHHTLWAYRTPWGHLCRALRRMVVPGSVLFGAFAVPAHAAGEDSPATAALHQLFKDERAFHYQENPGTGPVGEPQPPASRMKAVSAADHERRHAQARAFKQRLAAIDRAALSREDRLNYDLFAYLLERTLISERFRTWRIPFYSDSGFHTRPLRLWQSSRFRRVSDYDAYISRLADIPRHFDEHMANMRLGMETGFTMPKVVLKGLLPTFAAPIRESAEESAFWGPFQDMARSIDAPEKARLRDAARRVIMEKVMPAYERLNRFMRETYYPAARESIAATDLPEGDAYYRAMVRFYTTLDLTPEQVFERGKAEVARIRAEMEGIIDEVGFDGGFDAFLEFLRTDPRFYADSAADLLAFASRTAKRIDLKMPAFFGRLPRQPYGVEPVPAEIAPNYTTGRYVGAPLDAPRGGMYWVNTHDLKNRPLYAIPALTLHEAVPGHHHQSALSRELKDVPDFRVGLYPHAFGEGWGLYAEKLGVEMGIYQTPYEHFGRLTYEMWRACRLVMDTGMHAFGWSRDRAMRCLMENSALSPLNVRTETDRYISWPGQALAYKVGEMRILALRERAERELGAAFDIEAFHDRILAAGGMPLDVLSARVARWIDAQQERESP